MKHFALMALALLLAGCFSRPDIAGAAADAAAGADEANNPGSLIALITYWAIGLSTLGLFGAVLLGTVGGQPVKATRLAMGCGAIIIAGPILLWVGEHLWLISLLCAAVGLLATLWAHRKWIERLANRDLDGDNKIGDRRLEAMGAEQ